MTTLVAWTCALCLAGCAGEQPTPTPSVAAAQGSGVGKVIASEEWSLTLIDQPHKAETVGKGTNCGPYSQDIGCLRAAEGAWLIAPVRLTNQAPDLKFVQRSLFLVRDEQDRELIPASRNVHADYLWEMDDDRWEPTVNQIPDNLLDSGESIEGPIIFDLPDGATGLRLHLNGSSESIALGS